MRSATAEASPASTASTRAAERAQASASLRSGAPPPRLLFASIRVSSRSTEGGPGPRMWRIQGPVKPGPRLAAGAPSRSGEGGQVAIVGRHQEQEDPAADGLGLQAGLDDLVGDLGLGQPLGEAQDGGGPEPVALGVLGDRRPLVLLLARVAPRRIRGAQGDLDVTDDPAAAAVLGLG